MGSLPLTSRRRVLFEGFGVWGLGFRVLGFGVCLGHFQVGSYPYRSLTEGLNTL